MPGQARPGQAMPRHLGVWLLDVPVCVRMHDGEAAAETASEAAAASSAGADLTAEADTRHTFALMQPIL